MPDIGCSSAGSAELSACGAGVPASSAARCHLAVLPEEYAGSGSRRSALAARNDEARLVGRDDQLGAVAQHRAC